MAKKKIAEIDIFEGKYVTLRHGKKIINFDANAVVDEFLNYVTQEKYTALKVNVDACEDSIYVKDENLIELQDSRFSPSEYVASNLIKISGIGVKRAYAIACIFAIKQLPIDDMIVNFAVAHLLIGGVEVDNGIPELNKPYSVVVSKNSYLNMRDEYFTSIIKIMKIRKKLVNLSSVYEGFEKVVVETISDNEVCYTTPMNLRINEKTLSLIGEKSQVKLRGIELDDVNGDESQYDAINGITSGDSRLYVVQALPGAGKSATIAKLSEQNPGKVCVMAHFNSATNNIKERIPKGYSIPAVKVTKNGIEKYECESPMTITSTHNSVIKAVLDVSKIELLIVDESSVLSYAEIEMVYRVLYKCAKGCKLLLVGDINQCYPVRSRGLPMLEILHSEAKVFFLRKSHRMHPTMSQVITDCNKGMLKLKHDGEIVNVFQCSMLKACNYALKKYENAEHTGIFGMIAYTNDECKTVNARLDDIFLERLGLTRLDDNHRTVPNYVGRRVLSKDNCKKHGIARNNIFTIIATEKDNTTLEGVDGKRFTIPTDEVPDFASAWCCTVHSYQGSEVDEMCVAIDSGRAFYSKFRRNRNNTIVAMSRAKKLLTVIDTSEASVVRNLEEGTVVNNTGVQYRLENHETYASPKKKYECKSF